MGDTPFSRSLVTLEHVLEQCVDDVQYRPEAALWNARRAAESIASAVLAGTDRTDPKGEASLDGQVNQIVRTHQVLGEKLRHVKDLGNHGAHVRASITGDSQPWKDAGFAGARLAEAVDEFLNVCAKERKAVDAATTKRLRDLSARLDKAAKDAFTRTEPAKLTGHVYERLFEAQAQRDDARRKVEDLAQRIEGLKRGLAGDAPVRPPPAPRRWWPIAGAMAVAGGIGVLVGAIGALGVASLQRPAPVAAVAQAAPSPPVTPTIPVAAPVATPAPTPAPPAPAPPALTCPTGTVRLDASTFALAQPARKNWPTPAPPVVTAEHPLVCLDAQPVRMDAYLACVRQGRCTAPVTECERNPGPEPVNCVSHTQAAAYCAAQGARLPSLAEWEDALRANRLVVDYTHYEWADDVYPSPTLDRGPPKDVDGKPHHMVRGARPKGVSGDDSRGGWQHRAGVDSVVGFRCARAPR